MRGWIKTWWFDALESLWFLPAVLTVGAAALAFGLIEVESRGWLWSGSPPGWVYQGGGDAARTVLSAVTGSLITVTGVIFAVTMVAVQLASSQYTPRVLRNFKSDRGNQIVLGIFIGTFTYTVLVLGTVHSEGSDDASVPRLAITVSIALLIVSVIALIYFMNHVAQEIHVTAILDRVTRETTGHVHKLFPEHIGRAASSDYPDPRLLHSEATTVDATGAGYVIKVDEDTLFKIRGGRNLIIAMKPKIGAYVLPGRVLASVHSPDGALATIDESTKDDIRKAFVLGPGRTPLQDVEYGIVQVADIAIRALSPSINDPTTAMRCIDRLSEILFELGDRDPPEPRRTRDGGIHFIASYTTFERGVRIAFDGIRHFAAGIPSVAEHMLVTFCELESRLPADRRLPLREVAEALVEVAMREAKAPRDAQVIERAAAYLKDAHLTD